MDVERWCGWWPSLTVGCFPPQVALSTTPATLRACKPRFCPGALPLLSAPDLLPALCHFCLTISPRTGAAQPLLPSAAHLSLPALLRGQCCHHVTTVILFLCCCACLIACNSALHEHSPFCLPPTLDSLLLYLSLPLSTCLFAIPVTGRLFCLYRCGVARILRHRFDLLPLRSRRGNSFTRSWFAAQADNSANITRISGCLAGTACDAVPLLPPIFHSNPLPTP